MKVDVGEVALNVTVTGSGPAVVLLHGFPQTSYCWRHQVPALADAGYRVITPDLRGFGDSDSPTDVDSYRSDRLVADVTGLLDALDEDNAVIVGHDWGAQLAWWAAGLAPLRCSAVVGLSVPYTRRPKTAPIEALRSRAAGYFFYMDYFQDLGVAEQELEAQPARLLGALFHSASGQGPGPKAVLKEGAVLLDSLDEGGTDFMSEADLAEYVDAYSRSGWTGALNWYRAMDPSWHALPELTSQPLTMPSAFLAGAKDPVLLFTPMTHLEDMLSDLRAKTILPGVGHWIAEEAATETTEFLLRFLQTVTPTP